MADEKLVGLINDFETGKITPETAKKANYVVNKLADGWSEYSAAAYNCSVEAAEEVNNHFSAGIERFAHQTSCRQSTKSSKNAVLDFLYKVQKAQDRQH